MLWHRPRPRPRPRPRVPRGWPGARNELRTCSGTGPGAPAPGIIFSEDAVGLESALHREFAGKRVNLVNAHREFFWVSPSDVRQALLRQDASLLTFVETPEALEFHQSATLRGQAGPVAMVAG